MPDMIFSSR